MAFVAEPKPFASLTSSLLARKGGARPAMRRQATLGEQAQDDLGWNDMGHDLGHPSDPMAVAGLTPMPHLSAPEAIVPTVRVRPVEQAESIPDMPVPAVVEQQRILAKKVAEAVVVPPFDVVTVPLAPLVQPRKAKAAFTLRLDPERHLRLRLACAVGNRSAQQIVTQALDDFLAGQPDIDALADQVSRDANDIPGLRT
ncbi:hypothetical protein BH10PSE12_BH10PSE12_19140 [soil metagenome]